MKIQDDKQYHICYKCLSRIIKNPKYRKNLPIDLIKDGQKCSICDNLLFNEDKILELVFKKIKKLDIDFNTFIMACQVNNKQMNANEKKVHEILKYKGHDNIRKQLKRDIGVQFAKKSGKRIQFQNPDVIIMIKVNNHASKFRPFAQTEYINIFIDSNPLYIEGKYRKLIRGIPQTKWPCTNCKGRGCIECNHTGQQYPDSVEGLIAKPLLKMTRGDQTKFHGSGREDIDVLMLGEGRPFVIEVKHPFKRNINLKFLRRLINSHSNGKIEVNDLKFTDRERVGDIKNSSVESYKIYEAISEFENGVTSNDVKNIERLEVINQRTPQRVEHRRADLIRTRKIKDIKVERINSKKLKLIIKCQGGLYIKELISGDEGRTQPSISSITKNSAKCTQLNVIKVHLPQ